MKFLAIAASAGLLVASTAAVAAPTAAAPVRAATVIPGGKVAVTRATTQVRKEERGAGMGIFLYLGLIAAVGAVAGVALGGSKSNG